MSDIAKAVERLVTRVEVDENHIGVLSTGEYLAVALVLDRKHLLDEAKYTMLEAIERLGPDWFAAALQVQRSRR